MPADNSLHKAAHKGDLDECKKFIEGIGGEDVIDVNEPGASDRRALHRSAGAGHLQLCIYFVEKEAQVDLVSCSRLNPNDHIKFLKTLIDIHSPSTFIVFPIPKTTTKFYSIFCNLLFHFLHVFRLIKVEGQHCTGLPSVATQRSFDFS